MTPHVLPAVDYLWFHCVGKPYWWNPVQKLIVFTDGVKYTLDEALHLSKGKLDRHVIRHLHNVKKDLEGEILTGPEHFDHFLPEPDPEVPQERTVESVRPVPQKFYGRRKERSQNYTDPCQGVLNL